MPASRLAGQHRNFTRPYAYMHALQRTCVFSVPHHKESRYACMAACSQTNTDTDTHMQCIEHWRRLKGTHMYSERAGPEGEQVAERQRDSVVREGVDERPYRLLAGASQGT